jgi:hypothetical protein
VAVGQLEVPVLAELGVDPLARDQVAHVGVGVERLAVQRPALLLAVAPDQRLGAPLVARVDDPAVPGARPPAELVRLEHGDPRSLLREPAGRGDAGVAATDHDRVDPIRERLAGPVRYFGHRGVPVRPPLVVAIE